MPNLEQIALTAVRAINPNLAAQAEKEISNYTKDKAGLQKVIAKYGGEAFLNSAVNFANSAPRVRAMFDKFGIRPEALKDNVMKELQSDNPPINAARKKDNLASSRDRLNKLR